MNKKTIILAGSGHAHLEVLKSLNTIDTNEHQYFLVSPNHLTYYSGLIPRLISGDIQIQDLSIASAQYANSKGVTFVQDTIQSINSHDNTVYLKSGKKIGFDIISLNLGGTASTLPSQCPATTIELRPIDEFVKKWPEVEKALLRDRTHRIVVVGGGAAAVEVATALRIKLKRINKPTARVDIITKGSRLCSSYSVRTSKSIESALKKEDIHIHFNEKVEKIEINSLKLKNKTHLDFDLVFVVTPTQPSHLSSSPIDFHLQNSANIFSVGDGTRMSLFPELPRSGVIAVHQGRHLAKNLKKWLNKKPLEKWIPPRRQLNILITGHRSAHLVWGPISFNFKWVYFLKKWIDNRYVKQFNKK